DRDSVRTELAQLCTRTQRVAFRGTAYALTLSVHPLLASPQTENPAEKATKFYGLFPPIYATELEVDRGYKEAEPTWHPMHRWTGSSMIVFLAYAGDEDGGWDDDLLDASEGSPSAAGDYSVSLDTAKILMSSLNIAARNVRCRLPMFVPVGDAWRFLFTGRSLDKAVSMSAKDGKPSGALVADTKFDSIYLAQAPSAYLQLNGLLELFAGSFKLASYFKQVGGSNGTQTEEQKWAILASNVQLAALHAYHITNTYNRDWNRQSADFHYRQGDLNVGPANDPLRTMRLSACFQPAPCSTYISPQAVGRDRLYLKTATAWALAVQFLPADMERTMLTEALEDAFASWAQSASNAHRHRHLDLSDQMEAHAEITGDMLIDLFGSASGSLIQPPGTEEAESDAERRCALEERLETVLGEVYADAAPRPLSVAQLIARMPHGAAVPCHSLLWRLCEIVLVTTAKRSADFWRAPSIMTFLRLLWAMTVREVRWRWENREFIPKIASASECRAARDGAASSGMDTPNASLLGLSTVVGEQASKYDVHLRYALIYQKLEMLNCCQERRKVRQSPSPSHVGQVDARAAVADKIAPPEDILAQEDENVDQDPAANSSLAQRIRSHVKDQIRKHISSDTAGSSATSGGSWVPGSRLNRPIGRLLQSIRPQDGSTAAPSQGSSADRLSVTGAVHRSPAEVDGFEDIDDAMGSASDSDGFMSAEDADYQSESEEIESNSIASFVDRATESDHTNMQSSFGTVRLPPNAVQFTSDSSSKSMPIRNERHAHESSNYVDLTISSSIDSNSGFHHISNVHESERPSVMTNSQGTTPASPAIKQSSRASSSPAPQPELADGERAGGLMASSTMRILGTDEPLWIPEIQQPPVMSEDMLREREAILIGLGTSEEGTAQRARLQCAELISDMESFKAANPKCALADFVRWHSPRDWLVPEGGQEQDGCLSPRMSEGTNNLWQQLWSEARRVPAKLQKPLFDCEMEAEKALHYLEGVPVYSLFTGLLPTIFTIAYERLYRQPIIHRLPVLRSRLVALGAKMLRDVDWTTADPDSPAYSSILDDIESLEVQTSRCIALLHKFPDQLRLVERLVCSGQTSVDDRREQRVVLKALGQFNIAAMAPKRREYVFTANTLGIGSSSEEASETSRFAQRMHVVIEEGSSIRVVNSRTKAQCSL
ncbi:hypothetical protein EC988_001558, partial [Linderina pennispora]